MGFSLSSFKLIPKNVWHPRDSLSIKTTIPTPQRVEVNGKTLYYTRRRRIKNYSKEGAVQVIINDKFNGRKTANG